MRTDGQRIGFFDMTRAEKLISALSLGKQDAVLLHNPSNMFYISGYTGGGVVFVSGECCAVVTDFRYTEQAEQESPGFEVHMIENGKSHEDVVEALCVRLGIRKLYFEADSLTVQAFGRWQDTVTGVEWLPVGDAVKALREIKDAQELGLIERACAITSDAFERILPQIKEGMTEKQLALLLEFDMRSHGADGIAFPSIVAAGANGSLPHAVPSDYAICRGDMVTLDFGAKVGGYCADMTRTIAVGEPSAEMKKVYQTVKDAQQMAQDAVAAGKICRDVDAVARDYINSQGYEGRFGHGLGHCLGIDIHENPRLNTVTNVPLKVGQVVTVEPGIYLPGVGGVRIENTVAVTETGCRALTFPSRELIIL